MKYEDFVKSKTRDIDAVGIEADTDMYQLFPHQRDLVRWSLRRGRAAIFADTGLGKTRMQVAWADAIVRHTGCKALILAPLAVAEQTVAEAAAIGVEVAHAREASHVGLGITITNYDRLHKFDPTMFDAVVLDESSCIKHHDAKTLAILMGAFADARYRLCATATPAPNDWTELGTHAEFLGVRTRAEMLAEYFTHDGGETQTWRLKGHARGAFWRWVAGWGAMIRNPSDLGHDGSAYELPPLTVHQHVVHAKIAAPEGLLFAPEASTLMDRRHARRGSMTERVGACAEVVNATDRPWVVWCDLNAEGDALEAAIPGSVQVAGSDTMEHKEESIRRFVAGGFRVLISKPAIFGFGLNLQVCADMAFVGVTDSYEAYYQAVRRCWRFGQKRPVNVHVFSSAQEGAVVANIRRKEADAMAMADAMMAETRAAVQESVLGRARARDPYHPRSVAALPAFLGATNAVHQ